MQNAASAQPQNVVQQTQPTTDSAATPQDVPQTPQPSTAMSTPAQPQTNVQSNADGQNVTPDSIAMSNDTDKLTLNMNSGTANARTNTNVPPGMVERGFSENIRTDENMDAGIRQSFENDPVAYKQLGNKTTLAKAEAIFAKGTDAALAELNQRIGAGKINPEDVPLSRLIANSLAQRGDVEGARAVVSDVATLLTEAGQLSQAALILRNADPASVEQTIHKALDKINKAASKHSLEKWKAEMTDAELQELYSTDFGVAGAYEAFYEKVARRIGAEMPSTLWQKLTEIRRISMLLNPKTQVRNITGNVPLMGLRKASERLAGGIQDILVKTGAMDKTEQTRTFVVSRESRALARQLFDTNQQSLTAQSNKWDMTAMVRQYRKYFGKSMAGKAIDAVRAFTYNLLEAGDMPFFRSAFVDNAAQYIEAQGYKTFDDIPQAVIDKAGQAALEATFRDASALARLLNQMKTKGGAAGKALEILFPFTTTPINIAKRTYEYSPLGAIKVISDLVTHQDAAKTIDDITKTLTGSSVVALGFLLRSLGAITGARDKDPDKRAFDKATGSSPYSFFGKVSYDWLQPVGSLLAIGAETFDASNEYPGTVDKIVQSAYSAGDAYLNMTFFQSVLNLFRGYGSPTENILTEVATSGLMQFAPSMFGALARTVDSTVRSAQTGGNVVDDTMAGIMQKTPFASQKLPASVNVKGEENKRVSNVLLRVMQEFINPASVNTGSANAVDKVLKNLFETTGSKSVFPTTAPKTINGEKLTGEQLAQYQKTLGKTTYDILADAIKMAQYKSLTTEQQAEVAKDVIAFANDEAKREYAESQGDTYSSNYDDETDYNNLGTYFVYKQALDDLKATDGQNSEKFAEMVKSYRSMNAKDREELTRQIGDSSFTKLINISQSGVNVADYFKYNNIDSKQESRTALLSNRAYNQAQQKVLYESLFNDTYYDKYIEHGKPSGVSALHFVSIMDSKWGQGEKKDKVMARINALPISDPRKDALYFGCGYAKSTLYEAPWK